MATPVVEATNSGRRDTTAETHTVNLPASIAAGDLLVVFFGHKSVASGAAFPAGWTEFSPERLNAGGSAVGLTAAYRWADGGEGASISVTTTGVNTRMAYASYRISGAENPATRAPEENGTTANNTINPDPPTLTPTGGAKDYLWLVAFASTHGTITSSLPTNYTNNVGDGSNVGTSTHVGVGSGRRALNAASEDPGTFTTTNSSTTSAEEIAVMTVAIHPAAGGGTAVKDIIGGYIPHAR